MFVSIVAFHYAEGDRMERVWRELQDVLVALTSHATHVIAKHSGHFVHSNEPDVVIKGIQDIVHAYRTRTVVHPRDTILDLASRWHALSEDVGTDTASLNIRL